MRREFKKLRAKCKTNAQKRSFNKLIKAFAGVSEKDMDDLERCIDPSESQFDEAIKVLKDYLGNDLYACSPDGEFYVRCDQKLDEAFDSRDCEIIGGYSVCLGKFEGAKVGFIGLVDRGHSTLHTTVLGKDGVKKLNKYLSISWE